jgi:hypothetical protein
LVSARAGCLDPPPCQKTQNPYLPSFAPVRNQIGQDHPNHEVLKELWRGLKGVRPPECRQTALESCKAKRLVEEHFCLNYLQNPRNPVFTTGTSKKMDKTLLNGLLLSQPLD